MLLLPAVRPQEARRLVASALRWLDDLTLVQLNATPYRQRWR